MKIVDKVNRLHYAHPTKEGLFALPGRFTGMGVVWIAWGICSVFVSLGKADASREVASFSLPENAAGI